MEGRWIHQPMRSAISQHAGERKRGRTPPEALVAPPGEGKRTNPYHGGGIGGGGTGSSMKLNFSIVTSQEKVELLEVTLCDGSTNGAECEEPFSQVNQQYGRAIVRGASFR